MSKRYFHFHSNTGAIKYDNELLQSSQCQFIKADKHRCKRRCIIGFELCFSHRIKQDNIDIQPSTIPQAGVGLFADNGSDNNSVVFKKGDIIILYRGQMINKRELKKRYSRYTAPYCIQIDEPNDLNDPVYIDAALKRGLGSLINHKPHKNANCEFISDGGSVDYAEIVAIKDIKNGTELFVDYGNEYKMNEPVKYSTNRRKYQL